MRKVAQYINRRSFIGTTGTLTAGWVIVPGTFIEVLKIHQTINGI